MNGPTQSLQDAAAEMTAGNEDSIRKVVDEIYKLSRVYPMSSVIGIVLKKRLVNAQKAYFSGRQTGVTDDVIVDALNELATTLEAPEYARVSSLQVHFIRARLGALIPALFRPATPALKTNAPNPPMSPLQATFLMSTLIDQKIENPNFQFTPEEWDRDIFPKAVEQERARQELQKRRDSGEAQVRFALLAGGIRRNVDADLTNMLRRKIGTMSLSEGLDLFDQTFKRLGLDQIEPSSG